ncbi:MAG: GNAT family N-acetyltransferase [Aristaeellaceae bacterium]
MIHLEDITEANWLEAVRLEVGEAQRGFVAPAVGILARGYVYRHDRARVYAIMADGVMVGLALVRDLDEPPACYDLQQLMIDRRYQGRGYGGEALRLLLARLREEGRYDAVEVCVHREDAVALRLYGRAGFADTGYVDPAVPECLNLMHHFR